MTVRAYEPQDRARALQVLKEQRAIDDPSNHILVAEADQPKSPIQALALWHQPSAGPGPALYNQKVTLGGL